MKEEIAAGIRNALDRGDTLEEAMQSFINAGYNPIEVREASSEFSTGATTTMNPQIHSTPIQNKPLPKPINSQDKLPEFPPLSPLGKPAVNVNPEPKKVDPKQKSTNRLIIILSIVLFVLIGSIILLLLFGPGKA